MTKIRVKKAFLIIVYIFIAICTIYFILVFMAIKSLEKVPFDKLGPAFYKLATGLDLPKDGKLTQHDQEIIFKKAKYIRIELDDKMRQKIKETGRVCVPFPSESVGLLPDNQNPSIKGEKW